MPKSKNATIRLSVSLDNMGLKSFPKVVAGAKRAGMKVERQMKSIGVLSGSIPAGKVPALQKVKGIAHVEEERSYQLAPPESAVQ